MRKSYFNWSTWWGMAAVVLFAMMFLSNDSLNVKANSSSNQTLAEQSAGLSTAPPNLGLDPNMFTVPYFTTTYGKRNMAGLTDTTGHSAGTTTAPMKAIRMTNGNSQVGAIWSNMDGGNYINIRARQTMSMWLYFGPTSHADGSGFGDGMAFVIHKSPDGTNAIAHDGNKIGAGESLGVWGVDDNPNTSSTTDFAKTAIQNSWALEFDTHINNDASPSASANFDRDVSGQHMAYGYPADPATYTRGGSAPYTIFGTTYNGYYYTMTHTNPYNNLNLHDGNWHHLTVTWDPTKFAFTYVFNDKNRDGSKGTSPITVKAQDIQASEFGGYQNIADGKFYWGFTASTGSDYETNLVAFESIPSSVQGEIKPSLHDETQDQDIDSGGTVDSGDKLDFNYGLKYESGRDDWSNISAQLNLPAKITYQTTGATDEQVGVVTYADGTTEPIYGSDIKGTNSDGSVILDHDLTKPLNTDNPTAKITIYGTANNVNTDTKVASVHSHFDSKTLIDDTYMIPFVIKKAKPINLTLDKNNITVDPNQDANITGEVSYADGAAITNSNITVHATLNGTALDKFTLDNSDAAGSLNFTIPAAKLTQNSNTLNVYVMDQNGNRSSTSTVVIAKKGGLALDVKDYSFGDVNQVPTSRLIPRNGEWDITVSDSREDGTTSPWTLSTEADDLFSGDTKFNGNVVFKNSDGAEQNINSSSYTPIASGKKTQTGEQVTNVSQLWNNSDGLMLRTNGITTAGHYSGNMRWVLSDTV